MRLCAIIYNTANKQQPKRNKTLKHSHKKKKKKSNDTNYSDLYVSICPPPPNCTPTRLERTWLCSQAFREQMLEFTTSSASVFTFLLFFCLCFSAEIFLSHLLALLLLLFSCFNHLNAHMALRSSQLQAEGITTWAEDLSADFSWEDSQSPTST